MAQKNVTMFYELESFKYSALQQCQWREVRKSPRRELPLPTAYLSISLLVLQVSQLPTPDFQLFIVFLPSINE